MGINRIVKRLICASAVCSMLCALPIHRAMAQQDPIEQGDWNPNFDTAAPLGDNFVPPPGSPNVCGDQYCCPTADEQGNPAENPTNCPQDCGSCGDGLCNFSFETLATCPNDCGRCGDNVCAGGEHAGLPGACPQDCPSCGDGICSANESNASCPNDCFLCGDGVCGGNGTEQCPADCTPGCNFNGVCNPGENFNNCPNDCSTCGDGFCSPTEATTGSCQADCATCGNHVCQAANGENTVTCPADCSICGDGACTVGENSQNCVQDCPSCGDGVCTAPTETKANCVNDCSCNDGVCDAGEPAACRQADCGECGNGVCETTKGESLATCLDDCKVCGDDICSTGENCPEDCPVAECGDGVCTAGLETEATCPADCKPILCDIAACPDGLHLSIALLHLPNGGQAVRCGCCTAENNYGCHDETGICGCMRNCNVNPQAVECGGCFTPETMVLMGDKTVKPISKIKPGDKVWNPVTGQAVGVLYTSFGPEVIPMYQFGYGKTSVIVTSGHPMVINNRAKDGQLADVAAMFAPVSLKAETMSQALTSYEIRKASELKVGDKMLGADGKYHTLTIARQLPVKKDQQVVNLKIDTASKNPDDHMMVGDGVITGDLYLQEQLGKK